MVEDNEELAAYLVRKLSTDFRAITTVSAENALKILEQNDVGLVLSDIALTGMSGIELCGRITSDFNLSHIPVVMLSAISSTKTKITCMENGASLYIEKPFSLDYLLGSLKVIVKKRESLKAMHLAGKHDGEPSDFMLTNSDGEFLCRLDKVIMDNLSDAEFSLDAMAEAMFISKSTLTRKVKGLLGTTPIEYIRTKRLNVAASMLAKESCRTNEVCYAVGFNTPSYFIKCFKRQFGVLPSEYMEKLGAKQG